jgi:hypothetical protein
MRGDERFDELIDAALRSYAEPGEIPETRVALDGARAEATAQRRVWVWSWAVGAACVVALLVALGWMGVSRSPRAREIAWTPKAPEVVSGGRGAEVRKSTGAEAMDSIAGAARLKPCPDTKTCGGQFRDGAAGARATRVARNEQPQPKLDVFPTPTPLSPEEQALVAFAKYGPPAVQRAVLEDQKHWDDPIIVAELRAQPMQAGKPEDQ